MVNRIKIATTLVFFSSVLVSVSAFAADGDSTTTTGKISFKAGGTDPDGNGQTEKPTHPEKWPTEEIDPEIPTEGNTGNGGPLSLDFAPNFNFEEQTVATTTKTYNSDLVKDSKSGENVANFVQVSDKRGLGTGWVLSVSQNGQFKTEDGKILTGAELHLKNSTHKSDMPDTVAPKVVVSNDLVLGLSSDSEGVSSNLVEAGLKTGLGMHQVRFGNNNATDKEGAPQEVTAPTSVQLVVPGTSVQYAKEYATTLTWTLAELPVNFEV